MADEAPPRGRLRRWRWWIALLVVAVAVRVALPEIIRRVAISQAAANLRAEVDVGNVDLYLWRGGVVVEDFALRPVHPDAAAANADGSEPPRLPPIVEFKRLALGLGFRPLLDKTIQLYELVLEAPHVALDRLESGELNLIEILPPADQPAAEAAPPVPAAADEADPWRFGIDRIALVEGRITFRDLMMPGSEPIDLGIPTIEVRDVALDPQMYGEPSDFKVNVVLDDGSLDLGARVRLAADGTTALESELEARNLPLRRARIYVPEVGWSDLRGQLDASLQYRLETGASNELRGTVTLREVAVTVPELPEAALSWKSVSVRVDPVDLLAQSATVAEVNLDGVVLTVEPHKPDQLPVIARQVRGTPGAEETAATTAPPPPAGTGPAPDAVTGEPLPAATGDAPGDAPADDSPPWHWSLAVLRLTNSLVRISGEHPTEVTLGAELQQFSDAFERPGRVDLQLGAAGGTLRLAGDTRIEPPGFAGRLEIADVSIPELIAASAALPDSPLASARLDVDLSIAAGMPVAGAAGTPGASDLTLDGTLGLGDLALKPPGMGDVAIGVRALGIRVSPLELPGILSLARPADPPPAGLGDLRLQGELTLAEPKIQLADGKEFVVGARDIRLALAKLDLPEIAVPPAVPSRRPRVVAVRELVLDTPTVRLTRTAQGLVIPGAQPAASVQPGGPDAADPAVTAARQPPAEAEPEAPRPAAGPPLEFSMSSFRLTKGRIEIVDRAVKPEFKGALSDLEIQARDVRWPELAARAIKLTTRTPGHGTVEIRGDIAGRGGKVDLELNKVDLPSFNPYAATYSPFRLSGGALSLSTKGTFEAEKWDLGNSITMHQLAVGGGEGESLFQKEFGIPLATGLALLQDARGEIAMDVPIQMDREGTKIDVVGIAGSALRRALVNALTSPLRLLGAATGTGDKIESLAPAAIEFRRGLAEPIAGGDQRLEQLGAFLATRPAMGVEFEAEVTQSDVRWLREQSLRAQWEEEGLFARIASLGRRGEKGRIQDALAARAEGRTGELSPEDSQVLDEWLVEIPPPSPEQLAALADGRLARVEQVIRAQPGVAAERISSAPAAGEPSEGTPDVRIVLRAASPGVESDPQP